MGEGIKNAEVQSSNNHLLFPRPKHTFRTSYFWARILLNQEHRIRNFHFFRLPWTLTWNLFLRHDFSYHRKINLGNIGSSSPLSTECQSHYLTASIESPCFLRLFLIVSLAQSKEFKVLLSPKSGGTPTRLFKETRGHSYFLIGMNLIISNIYKFLYKI